MSVNKRSLIRLENLDPYDFIIKWRMTEMCNIRCSYCLHSVHDDNRVIDTELLHKQEERLCVVADKLNALIDRTRFKNVKIDFIGGEVTLFDLKKIISNFHTSKLKRINITTNLMREKEYYIGLAEFCTGLGISLTLTASFHYEFQDIDVYFDKVSSIKDLVDIFACEMVSTADNQDLCREFDERCKDIDVDYMIEADLRMESENARREGLITASRKPKKGMRYKAYFSDGSCEEYETRNKFLYDASIKENCRQKMIETKGFFCTNTYDYFYLDFDMAAGRTESSDSCTNRIPIEEFKIIEPRMCPHSRCTLCGHQSIWRKI